MKATVKQNRYGNWRGYIGGKFEREFPQYVEGSGIMPPEAVKWMDEQNGVINENQHRQRIEAEHHITGVLGAAPVITKPSTPPCQQKSKP